MFTTFLLASSGSSRTAIASHASIEAAIATIEAEGAPHGFATVAADIEDGAADVCTSNGRLVNLYAIESATA